jgi:hypothetical protein
MMACEAADIAAKAGAGQFQAGINADCLEGLVSPVQAPFAISREIDPQALIDRGQGRRFVI